jgi:hypothetical protein
VFSVQVFGEEMRKRVWGNILIAQSNLTVLEIYAEEDPASWDIPKDTHSNQADEQKRYKASYTGTCRYYGISRLSIECKI